MLMNELENARKEINAIDEQMAKLFEARMKVCARVAAYKQAHGLSIRDRERENELINKNRAFIEDADINPYYTKFIRATIDLSCAYQLKLMQGLKAVYCGAAYIPARNMFPDAELIECESIEKAYAAVETGEPDVAVLPLDGEDGAKTAELLFSGELYVNQICDMEGENGTVRYGALSRVSGMPSAGRKRDGEGFILTFTVRNETGAPAQVLNIIGAHGYNMRTLRSCPKRELPWNSFFYLEAEGCIEGENGKELLQELNAVCAKLKLAGSFYTD